MAKLPKHPFTNKRRLFGDAAWLWERYCEQTVSFLERLRDVQTMHGEVWRKKMRAYYLKVAKQLVNKPPAGCESKMEEFLKRLKNV